MTKGTSSKGGKGHHTHTHTLCRRCGKVTFHLQKKVCAACGFPAARMRRYNWSEKANRRRTTGTGRMRSLAVVRRSGAAMHALALDCPPAGGSATASAR